MENYIVRFTDGNTFEYSANGEIAAIEYAEYRASIRNEEVISIYNQNSGTFIK